MNRNHKQWKKEESVYLLGAYPGLSVKECAAHLGRTERGIKEQLRKLGVKRKRIINYVQRINLSLVKTPRFAYLLGFLWADGCVYPDSFSVASAIHPKDAPSIKPILDYTGLWFQKERKTKAGIYFHFGVWDKAFNGLLRELDYPDKSVLQFRKVCEYLGAELVPYFIHGFFDGDGSVICRSNGRYAISFAGPLSYDWSYLQEILVGAGIDTSKVAKSLDGHGGGSALYVSKRADIIRFYRMFMNHPGIGLTRKEKRFREVIANTWESAKKICRFTMRAGRIRVVGRRNGKSVYVGTYDTPSEAVKAKDEWDRVHNPERLKEKADLITDLEAISTHLDGVACG